MAEHRPEVPKALRSVVCQVMFNHASDNTGGIFRTKRKLFTV